MQTLQVNTTLNIDDYIISPEYEALVPPLSEEEYEELKTSIDKDGLFVPITINENKVILDGHHRFKACKELGVQPKYSAITFETKLHEKKYVIEVNVYRRQLSVFMKIEISLTIIQIERQISGLRQESTIPNQGQKGFQPVSESIDANTKGKTVEIISAKIDTSSATIQRALYVIDNGTEEVKESARKGTNRNGISIWNAYKQTKHRVETPKDPLPLPDGEFSVIYADPPWHYTHSFLAGSPDLHYTTMETEEICKLEVPSHKNAVLFLWVTNPLLEDGLRVLNEWGFKYKTNIVWVKDRPGTGHYVRGQHELLLIATRGNIGTPPTEARISSVLMVPRRKHSEKPTELYEIIEAMYPHQKYLELFARKTRENWTSWGVEIG